MKTTPKTKALFRRAGNGPAAVFPGEPPVIFWPKVGFLWTTRTWVQHCTQPATPAECRRLRAALKARGYGSLQVIKRWPRGKATP